MVNNKSRGFNLIWILSIVVVTSIISALTTGVIVYNNNKITNKLTYGDLAKDENLNQFLEVYANIVTEYYQDVNKKELLEKAIAGMMDYLGDDYSSFLNNTDTDNLFDQLSGEYKGIGVSIDNSTKAITKVYKNTPASKAGIQVGDIIIGFNEIDTSAMNASDIVDLIKKSDDYFTLKLTRGDINVTATLKNENIISPNIDYKIIENTNIGYLYIQTFSNTLDVQIREALTELENSGITSLIIDVRNNTGGYLDAATKVANMFLTKGKRIYSLDYKGELTHFDDETEEHREYNIAVLVNESTASASEILAAALKESYGAQIIGETTFGKGKVQQTMKLEGGTMVKYTSSYWNTPNGNCIDGKGIVPDYLLSNEVLTDENGTITELIDKQLEKAIEVLSQ
ncbi:MAG: S41 family peptidase [Bacilli bacterium]|jgi:carboxyl-terminal processing protease|nr:S41 family peptidase [Bacilli bacterium]